VAGLAAMVASAISTVVAHPIDTIKTRIQAGKVPMVLKDSFLGLGGLYRGLSSNVLKEAPNAGIYLGVYELTKTFLIATFPAMLKFPLAVFMVAGAVGDAVGSIVRVPAEVVNKRLQLGLSDDWRDAVRETFFSSTGLRSTLNIWAAILLRDVPYGALQIGIYEQCKLLFRQNLPLPGPGLGPALEGISTDVLIGAAAGLVAAFLTTPSDVLVTRLSSQNSQSYLETREYVGIVATFRRIIAEEGFLGLWRGSIQRGVYYMPLIGIFFAIYELTKHFVVHPDDLVAFLNALDMDPLFPLTT